MIKVKGTITPKNALRAPEQIVKKLSAAITCELTEREIILINGAIKALSNQLELENKSDLRPVGLVFTDSDEVTYSLEENQLGSAFSVCTYMVHKWRKNNYNDWKILAIILEELCHHFWNIEDEFIVTEKVLEVVRRIDPAVEMHDLYNLKELEKIRNS